MPHHVLPLELLEKHGTLFFLVRDVLVRSASVEVTRNRKNTQIAKLKYTHAQQATELYL